MLQLLFGLLPVAASFGWYAGRKKSTEDGKEGHVSLKIRRDYFRGLNYLINEQPDKAVDVFIRLLEVDSDTVETHLALGSLFRRRGEVERAIRIHQNLIARPNLPSQHRLQALSELGQDYLRAGVLDRAERLFLEVISLEERNQASYQFLLNIYQQEKDWHKAIEVARKLEDLSHPMGVVIAHYYCELADEYSLKGETALRQNCLRRALQSHPACVRALLMRADDHRAADEHKQAIALYHKVIRQSPDFLPLSLTSLVDSYRCLREEDKLLQYLKDCLRYAPQIPVVVAITNYIQQHQSPASALDFIYHHVKQEPSLMGLKSLVSCYLNTGEADTDQRLRTIETLLNALLVETPNFQCLHCGFASKSLFWLCPSCHHWETIKPLHSRELS